MRFLLASLVLLLLAAGPASAYDTPEALVEALYAPYLAGEIPQDEAVLRSLALQWLYDADAARTPEGDAGRSISIPWSTVRISTSAISASPSMRLPTCRLPSR